jgi:hypothetical protein
MDDRLKKALQSAQDAFWHEIATAYPEAKSGDFPPDASYAFDVTCESAVKLWLHYNV